MIIPFCKGDECPIKFECVRFLKTGANNQPTYSGFNYPEYVVSPYNKESKSCLDFWKKDEI